MNRFREWILDHIGYYEPDHVKGKLSKKVISKKELTRIKKESKIEKVEKALSMLKSSKRALTRLKQMRNASD